MARELGEDKSREMGSSGGFCYSEVSPNNPSIQTQFTTNQIQDFHHHQHHEPNNPEMFNLTTGMEMIGFSKNHQTSPSNSSALMWKESSIFNKPDHHHHQFTTGISETTSSSHDQNLMTAGPPQPQAPPPPDQSGPWQENRFLVDDSSLRCVFPCEGNERPGQGLSLTLSSTNPSTIGLQTFELRHAGNHHQQADGFFGKPMIQDGFLGKSTNHTHYLHHSSAAGSQFHLRNSRFLVPAQELLNEFCSLGTRQTDLQKQKSASQKNKQWEDQENGSNVNGASSSRKQSLCSLDFLELQKRKTKLLSMLEEVERRYKNYCDQMKAVVSSFEAVAGAGAATVYSALASKAMSRHFRCLKDGIVSQIQATRKAMGEKDVAAPGTSRGETPRLRVLDQALRQQRAFQQMSMMESHPWRPQRGLPERSVSVLRAWLFEHFLHPYPSDVDKHILARQTGLSRSQVSNWFINARVRLWKPMVEEMYVEETKEQLEAANINNIGSSSDGVTMDLGDTSRPALRPDQDQKPTVDQLVRIDSECLSSIVINPDKTDLIRSSKALQTHPASSMQVQRHQNYGRFPEAAFGAMELDFSSYNQQQQSSAAGTVLYPNDSASIAFNGGGSGGGGVSLTLGLQQHAGGGNHGVSLAFSSASQSSLFYPRDHEIDDQCQPGVQYSLLDGDQGQNLPYRNLMGAQLLHDLA